MDRMDTALQAAWQAGDILLERFSRPKQLTMKGVRDVVTDADYAAQAVILDTIRRTFPEHEILAEEGVGSDDFAALGDTPLWVIDPLDGTTNYSRQFPIFCVSIGLVQSGVPILGVIHDPLRQQTFVAERGRGAEWLTDTVDPTPLAVSPTPGLAQSVIGLDWSHDDDIRMRTLDALRPVALVCRSVRAIGSAALGLAYLAAGWIDGYFHFSMLPWDVAAGAVIAAEAGATLTTPDGRPWQFGEPRLVVSNARIHAEMLAAMNGGAA